MPRAQNFAKLSSHQNRHPHSLPVHRNPQRLSQCSGEQTTVMSLPSFAAGNGPYLTVLKIVVACCSLNGRMIWFGKGPRCLVASLMIMVLATLLRESLAY